MSDIRPPKPPHHFFQKWKMTIFGFLFLFAIIFAMQVYNTVVEAAAERNAGSTLSSQMSNDANATGSLGSDAGLVVNNFQNDPYIGAEDPILTIVAFEDFGCPFCQKQQIALRQTILDNQDIVRFVYRDFPITSLHPQAQQAAEAAQCAHEQDAFWEYHDTLFANQERHSFSDLQRYAQTIGLDMDQFTSCLENGVYTQEVLDDYADGVQAGVTGTPTFFFNGQKLAGVITLEGFQEIINYFKNN